ncbi:hypothetical protein BDN70DRAFT_995588 [Pholiota conissans]|uniref:NmrA-like domain-containing protein n=1 Tax=Pholiota conissans TaxID=109636 RepID=A0A9P6CXQ5_9AGAR|nr:hypothetical protein BDN70DRAFT_995588 [Pholiota conissans]
MSAKLNIFITGATGYVGGSVVSRLLKHRQATSFEITALLRSAEKAEKLHTLGIKTVLGSYTDKDLGFLTKACADADVANSDNLPATEAILDGLKIRHEKTGKASILIHTSGSAIIIDDARGLHGGHKVYSDLESEALNTIAESVLHRNVDIPIVEADKAGYVKAYLITLAADLFIIIFDAAISNSPAAGHGTEGYYFAENFEYTGLEVAKTISEKLFELGVASSPEPKAFTQDELDKNFGGDRGQVLGWTPKFGKEEFLTYVKEEVTFYTNDLKA